MIIKKTKVYWLADSQEPDYRFQFVLNATYYSYSKKYLKPSYTLCRDVNYCQSTINYYSTVKYDGPTHDGHPLGLDYDLM